jgi:hypothetical protein
VDKTPPSTSSSTTSIPTSARTTLAQASPQRILHFTPTRASWLNQVEIWFSILQGKSLHGASFASVEELRTHIVYNQTRQTVRLDQS